MNYGLSIPNFMEYADARILAQLAYEAENSGWDGFFLWDHMLFNKASMPPIIDPWIALTAVALRTQRIRIGTGVTPLPRRRPWKLARETVTLDHLSGGRLILGVGLGWPTDADFSMFAEETDDRVRAEMLDEGLEVLNALWSGVAVTFHGRHYQVEGARFLPQPFQTPRIPVWVAGTWPRKGPFRRAAAWDGVWPMKSGPGPNYEDELPTPDELQEIREYIKQHRTTDAPLEVVLAGETPADDTVKAREIISSYAEVGLTWWIETIEGIDKLRPSIAAMRARIRRGPVAI